MSIYTYELGVFTSSINLISIFSLCAIQFIVEHLDTKAFHFLSFEA